MLDILTSSITVTAAAHNPSILHPSFLRAQGITPVDWELSEGPICTPALSVVKFSNGLVITVEPSRLQVLDNSVNADPRRSAVPVVTRQYIATLPHVRYTGVGVNFTGFIEDAAADEAMKHFLAAGAWSDAHRIPKSVGVRFVYDALGVQFRLAIDAGSVERPGDGRARSGLVMASNYHTDISEQNSVDQAASATDRFVEFHEHFRATVNAIFDQRSQHAAG